MTVVHCPECRKSFPGPDALERHRADCLADKVGVVWEEPPVGRRRGKYAFSKGAQEMLRVRPNEWARIMMMDPKSGAANACSRFRKSFPDFEFRAGAYMSGSAVWARYVGKDKS